MTEPTTYNTRADDMRLTPDERYERHAVIDNPTADFAKLVATGTVHGAVADPAGWRREIRRLGARHKIKLRTHGNTDAGVVVAVTRDYQLWFDAQRQRQDQGLDPESDRADVAMLNEAFAGWGRNK